MQESSITNIHGGRGISNDHITQDTQRVAHADLNEESEASHHLALGDSDVSTEDGNHVDTPAPPIEPSEDALKRLANRVFRHGFEASYSLLIGKHGCPFVSVITSY